MRKIFLTLMMGTTDKMFNITSILLILPIFKPLVGFI